MKQFNLHSLRILLLRTKEGFGAKRGVVSPTKPPAPHKEKLRFNQRLGLALMILGDAISDFAKRRFDSKNKKRRRVTLALNIALLLFCASMILIFFIEGQPAKAASNRSSQSLNSQADPQPPVGIPVLDELRFPCSYQEYQMVHPGNNPNDTPITPGNSDNPTPVVPPEYQYVKKLVTRDDTEDLQNDWLSGNKGRFLITRPEDTYAKYDVGRLRTYTNLFSAIIVTPIIVLVGYQVMISFSGFRYAGALEGLSRVMLGVMAVAVCIFIIQMAVEIENAVNGFIIGMHQQLGYPSLPDIQNYHMSYTLESEKASSGSYRGLVMPIARWGCTANDFVSITGAKFWGDIVVAFIPFVSGLGKLVATIKSAVDLIHHIGQFMVAILSISIAVQVFVRIIFLNFYIVTCPIAFACWALPGGMGQKVVQNWLKGFFSVLFLQTAQLFVITVAPLVIPVLPDAKSFPFDNWQMLASVFVQLPPIFVLIMTLRVPTMMGSSTAKSIATAGTVAGGAISAIGMSIYKAV